MITWTTAKTVLLTVGPFLLPRIYGLYRSLRVHVKTASATRPIPLSRPSRHSLNILFVSSVICLLLTLPHFAPENIYTLTSSRIQTPPDVLFNRLAQLRPNSTLTASDQILRSRLISVESRLLYLTYGPDPLANCTFCSSDVSSTYLYYSLPTLLTPHGLHALALGLATSLPITGRAASKWRFITTLLSISLPIAEIVILATYDHKSNSTATTPAQLTLLHWWLRTYRYLLMAMVDLGLAFFVYTSATNRLFVTPPSLPERTEEVTKRVEVANRKMHALGILKNAVSRDERLRGATSAYWEQEGKAMGEVFEEREVLDRVREVLGRVDVRAITDEASKYADGVVGGVRVVGGVSGA
ncbi:MAG: hypothetical protein M1837_006058 [Sclerophora amabilis]|nr:MAG: hypothetical protein M1837_006058 [Sclerophora amabilis]